MLESRTSKQRFDTWHFPWKAVFCLVFGVLITAVGAPEAAQAGPNASTTYYVDCQNGGDGNTGKSTQQAWRTLDRANEAELLPGDSLYFKRGCSWAGKLLASWNGTASARIRISAYGSGALPLIHNRPEDLHNLFHNNVLITGSYLAIENLATTIVDAPTDPGCADNPIGFYIGFNFVNEHQTAKGASYNTLRYVKAYGHTAGIHINTGANHNRIAFNTITENRAMSILTPISVNATDDLGAWGMLVKGNNNEIARNYLANNNAYCTYDTAPHGNTIEIYEGQYNRIHHNMAVNDRVFSELGGSPTKRAQGNIYYYNVVTSNRRDARFIVARGNGNIFGPTKNTRVFHNTVYFTDPTSQGIVCGANCDDTILKAQGNIIWAEEKAIFADGRINERFNIFWNSSGEPMIQLMSSSLSGTSLLANPLFASPDGRNFSLMPDSPAIDGARVIRSSRDIEYNPVPTQDAPDIGSLEWQDGVTSSALTISVGADVAPLDDAAFEALFADESDLLLDDSTDETGTDETGTEQMHQILLPLIVR